LVSAVPPLLRHTVSLCVGILIVITIMNLRGVREAGTAFAVPTCLFVGTLLITIVIPRSRVHRRFPSPASDAPSAPPSCES
jgi:amino acid transporter